MTTKSAKTTDATNSVNTPNTAGATGNTPGAGTTDEPAVGRIDPDDVWSALRTVIDPEIGLDIVSLGLVYDLRIEGPRVAVTMTLTTPGCPLEHAMRRGVAAAVGALPGVEAVDVQIVWEPRWDPSMIAPEVLEAL